MTSNNITDLLYTTVVIEGGSFQTGPPEKELSTTHPLTHPHPPPMDSSACK